MVEPLRHRQTKEAANGYAGPNVTAPHPDSTRISHLKTFGRVAACERSSARYIAVLPLAAQVLCADPHANGAKQMRMGAVSADLHHKFYCEARVCAGCGATDGGLQLPR